MSNLQHLLDKNKKWAEKIDKEDPGFFAKLSEQQTPEYLWIGCSDSRVSADAIVDLLPGEIFVHRNVANLVIHTDLNCLSVIQFAVEVLKVKHIIVCGHYNCGGVKATLDGGRHGLIDNWLCHIQDIYRKHQTFLEAVKGEHARLDRMCELNVIEQVENISQTTILREAWIREQNITVHGWIYRLQDGRIRDMETSVGCGDDVDIVTRASIDQIYKTRN